MCYFLAHLGWDGSGILEVGCLGIMCYFFCSVRLGWVRDSPGWKLGYDVLHYTFGLVWLGYV